MDERKKLTEISNAARQITEIKPFAEYNNLMASIRSDLKAVAEYKNQTASIISAFNTSALKAIAEHKNWMASIRSTLEILSKPYTLSSIRDVIEANKSILAITEANMFVNSMARSLGERQQQTQEIMRSLNATLDMPAMLSASLVAQSKLFELQRFPLGAAINAAASLQESLRLNLDRFTANYRKLVDFTNHQSSIIETLKPDIIQYPAYEVFREAELLEQITVPEAEQEALDEYEVIAIPEERPLEDRLGEINSSLPNLLQGARAALNADNPDRARHVASSLRELIGYILRQLAPEDKIRVWATDSSYYHNGRPTRRTQLLYICREINFDHLSEFVDADVELALTLINALHAEAHVIDRRLTDRQLEGLMDRTESLLLFLLRLNYTNE